MKSLSKILFLIFCLASLFLASFAEIFADWPLPLPFYVICVGITVLLFGIVRSKKIGLATIIYVALLASLHFAPWSPRKKFLRDLYNIQPGMSVTEARSVMKDYAEGTGWPANPFTTNENTLVDAGSGQTFQTKTNDAGEMEIKDSIVFRHDIHDGRFNSDFGVVEFKSNRVVSIRFLPD